MTRILTSVFITLLTISVSAAKTLSPDAKISLLTCSPSSNDLYTIYGHSALRVNDGLNNLDVVFNYGTFDFSTPNFYLKFANGNLNYFLAARSYNSFLRSYFNNEQNVWEQEINLTPKEKQALFDALVTNAKKENMYYRYDFFFDNCATRIRDIVFDNIDGDITYRDSTETIRSFRTYIHEYEAEMPWVLEGLDLLLGMKTDNDAYIFDQMFLPDYMMLYFGKASIVKDGENRNMIKEMKPLLRFDDVETKQTIVTPSLFFWCLLALSLVLLFFEVKKWEKPILIINRILYILTGLVGLLIVFLWFLSRHDVTGENLNILWAFPLNIILAFLPVKTLKTKAIKIIYIISLALLLSIPLLWFAWPQHLPPMVFPLSILLFIRQAYMYKYLYK